MRLGILHRVCNVSLALLLFFSLKPSNGLEAGSVYAQSRSVLLPFPPGRHSHLDGLQGSSGRLSSESPLASCSHALPSFTSCSLATGTLIGDNDAHICASPWRKDQAYSADLRIQPEGPPQAFRNPRRQGPAFCTSFIGNAQRVCGYHVTEARSPLSHQLMSAATMSTPLSARCPVGVSTGKFDRTSCIYNAPLVRAFLQLAPQGVQVVSGLRFSRSSLLGSRSSTSNPKQAAARQASRGSGKRGTSTFSASGRIVSALPGGSFLVELEAVSTPARTAASSSQPYSPAPIVTPPALVGKQMLCSLGGKLRLNRIRVQLYDLVDIEFCPLDPSRGRIVYRRKSGADSAASQPK
ncbi:hypothetical protein BESB_038730 [Besnoitia besnoiti]|uniref:S1-like domain-containing protein n=1 Tax=Besnoitia besnoiti TaxID=94643 RepID=A0A2A9MHH3_BESBE|nr:hypothetical protein BESB_038730 [Besnoitia besnoiti]PFH37415.1 hypothetical protein BESB_038730 [Besnoitia besnoiti]